jgi:hypothetical protein
MKLSIIVQLQIEGIHYWKDCNISDVIYLKHPHRHVFYVTLKKQVSHSDRDIEIIKLKHEVITYFEETYFDNHLGLHNFRNMSCEDIAIEILNKFNCNKVKVLEDNENGAEVKRH